MKKNSTSSTNSSPAAKLIRNGSVPKPGSGEGRVIRIFNYHDESIYERVLLNLRTSQSFDEVIEDLGHVVKLKHADRMYTTEGYEVKSFSELRNIYNQKDTFYISMSKPNNNNNSNNNNSLKKDLSLSNSLSPRTRSQKVKSPRSAPASLIDTGSTPIKVTIKGTAKEFYPPSKTSKLNTEAPENKLKLDWVYGYNGAQDGDNLSVTKSGELLYFVATVVVIYNKAKETQRYYVKHTEDVMCMDVHLSKNIALSGQRAGKNHGYKSGIHIWSLDTLDTIDILEFSQEETGVCSVGFSSNSTADQILIVSVIQLPKSNYLSVWDYSLKSKKFNQVAKVSTGITDYSGCSFHPLDNHLIITYGEKHLIFWTQKKDGTFESTDLVPDDRSVTCLSFLESGDVIAGDDSGMIGVYSVNNQGEYFKSHEFHAHNQGVASVILLDDGTLLSAGIQDCNVMSWETTRMFEKKARLKLKDGMGSVKTMCLDGHKGNLYVGTNKNCILGGSMNQNFGVIVWGHDTRLSALAAHPDHEIGFVTTGYDKMVTRWKKQKIVWQFLSHSDCLSADFHPNGSVIALSTLDGLAIVLNGQTGTQIWTMQVCTSPLNAIKYSPDNGNVLAMASHNGTVHTFGVINNTYKRNGRKDVGSSIMHLDWSKDADQIQLVTVDYNLIFMDAKAMKISSNPSLLRDVTWPQQTCTIGYAVAGTWNNSNYKNNPTTTTAVHVAKDIPLLAAGDSHGYIRLFRYPCPSSAAKFVEVKGSSSAITDISFLAGDQYLLTVCGSNVSLMRWKII